MGGDLKFPRRCTSERQEGGRSRLPTRTKEYPGREKSRRTDGIESVKGGTQ